MDARTRHCRGVTGRPRGELTNAIPHNRIPKLLAWGIVDSMQGPIELPDAELRLPHRPAQHPDVEHLRDQRMPCESGIGDDAREPARAMSDLYVKTAVRGRPTVPSAP